MVNFNDLLNTPNSCIFALKNDFDKRVYIGYTRTLKTILSQISSEIQYGYYKYPKMISDASKLKLEVLEQSDDIETMKLKVKYYIDFYRNNGYSIYNPTRKHLEYKVRIRISNNLKYVLVLLVNTRNDKKIVGVFKTKQEATEFVDTAYGTNNPYKLPVYANNVLTRAYVGKYLTDVRVVV